MKKKAIHIFSRSIWTLVCLYAAIVIAFRIPQVQEYLCSSVSEQLSELIHSEVTVENINPGFLNKLIIDKLQVKDQNKEVMLKSSRVAVSIDLLSLVQGRIDISSAQLFGLMFNAYKTSEQAPYNFQYAIDALSSADTTSQSGIDLHIGSLVIRNGEANYDLRYIPKKHSGFDANHISISGISGHFIIYRISDSGANLAVKHLAFTEKSGFTLSDLQLSLNADKENVNLSRFNLQLPHSFLSIPSLKIHYPEQNNNFASLLSASCEVSIPSLYPSDFQAFIPFETSDLPVVSGKFTLKESGNKATATVSLKSADNNLAVNALLSAKDIFMPSEPKVSDLITWKAEDIGIKVGQSLLNTIHHKVALPEELLALGDISLDGDCRGTASAIDFNNTVSATQCGNVALKGRYDNEHLLAEVTTDHFDLSHLLAESGLGVVALDAKADLTMKDKKLTSCSVDANIPTLEYNAYSFSNIAAKGTYNGTDITGELHVNDANIVLDTNADVALSSGSTKHIKGTLNLTNINPAALNLTDKWRDASFSCNAEADIEFSDIDHSTGFLTIKDFVMRGGHPDDDTSTGNLNIDNITLLSENSNNTKNMELHSDFADIVVRGSFTPTSLQQGIQNILASHIGNVVAYSTPTNNDLTINANIRSTYPLHRLLGVNINISKPVTLKGYLTDAVRKTNIMCNVPSIDILGHHIEDAQVLIWTPDSGISSRTTLTVNDTPDDPLHLTFDANAKNNVILSNLKWNNDNKAEMFKGNVSTNTELYKAYDGSLAVRMGITPSTLHLGDSIWNIRSNGIEYENSKLKVDKFFLGNNYQNINIDGVASTLSSDTLMAKLKSVNVAYIMNLVNFHSVEFGGFASGDVYATKLFTEPEAKAKLVVDNFLFEYGRMGNLHIDASLNNVLKQIDVKAFSEENNITCMRINGNVSPQREDINLDIDAEGVRLEFMESFCGSFMKDIDVYGNGRVRLFGPFSNINLEGKILADGALTVSSLNCRYKLHSDTITFVPDEISMKNQALQDKYGNIAYITGGLHHKHLTRMTYDFDIDARNFLCYDFHEFGNDTFYGTAFLTGKCGIIGRSSELTINVNGDVEKGSRLVYNASSPDNITRQEFITWHSQSEPSTSTPLPVKTITPDSDEDDEDDVRTNMHMNLLLNVPSAASLYLVMDPNTGDYIDLHGTGVLRANYYNKGSLELFGNYLIEHGIYKMTIQNIIHRDFAFMPGGSIGFGGDPYNASLNMQAKYTLNSVSLSDLNVGRSFSSNNIKVDCLMDITGTPGNPLVSFNIDPQTANTDAKQMIHSLINSEEEMNQQVLYLLAVGRFYAQGNNNASLQENRNNSQTTLAMQSIVSGTISQQVNNLLGNLVNSNKWNFGANISPGNDGFNNAEYEGLLNGSLFNNRLLFNGQFGYRDNAQTANQGFIGDFDLRYLLFPNGNLAIRFYNQTNDRYFTRNSLNTQGVGLIIKKDF